ncbi:hypothetical protein Avbf_11795 [Armadillidium vulgare]|nr:hypothetical protein Avbf_11795 [Armadillidium vulgare]
MTENSKIEEPSQIRFVNDYLKSSKFDKIVVLGNSSYKYYLEQLRGPKVCVMSDDISTDDLLSYIKCKEPFLPSKTLWVLVTGIEFLFSNSINMLCSSLRCIYPLQSTIPSDKVALYSQALITVHEMKKDLNIIEQNVKSVLNSESDFIFFPPIPPAMIIDSSIAHQDLHRLMVKYPKCCIVTKIIASYFIDIFKEVSFSFGLFTSSALEDMGISADAIKKYFDYQQNQIDFIYCGITLPPTKLPFFIEWSNTFRDIVSSCVGDSCFEISSERESYFKSSRILIYSDDENDETDFESRAVLSEYEKKSLSRVKSDGRSVSQGSSKNKCQYEVIDFTRESDVGSVESVVECKSSIVKATVSLTKPLSKDTFEKSVKDPKPKLSIKKVKQPIVKQKCNIYEIAADDRPLPFLDSLESDAKPETLTTLYVPDPKSEQDMESEIFDNFEEVSEENLYSEISNDSADNISNIDSSEEFSEENLYSEISNDSADNISNIDSSKDAKELSSKSVKEHLNKKPSNDSTFHITTQIVSRNLKEEETENINTVGDSKTKEKVLKSSSNEQLNLVETTKEFSGKVSTNIPDNKETYNDEVKRQNLFEDRCQMNEEKVNKTKETAKNLIIKDTNNKMQNVDTEDYTTTQPLKINGKETDAKNKLENPDITKPQSTLIKTVEDCEISKYLGWNCENTKNKQKMDTTVHLPVLIKTIENVTTQPLRLNDKESLEIDHDDTLTDANSKDMKWESTVNENLEEKGKNENMNVTSSFVEVIQSDVNHLNNSVELGKNSEFSSNILPLEEESSDEDMYKSSKIEENSDSSCDDNKSDLSEYIQEQLLIEEELEDEIFGDEECSYDDDDAAAEPDRENIPTSTHAYCSLSKEEKLHSDNSDIQIESFLNNVKEVALEINNVSKDKEDLESCESTSVLENDTKISVSETKSDNITKETLNITVGHISECNFSSGSIPDDKDFASNDSSQALTHVTIDNDLKIDESFRKSEDSEDKHEVKMDSFDYDLLNKESDIIFDLEKASDSQSSNERFGNSEEKNVSNNEQDIENKKDLQDSLSNKIESSARGDIKSQSQNVSEIALENLDTSNQVPKFTDIFDETVIRCGKLENFDSKIEVVQDLCDEGKANEIEDVAVAVTEKTFEKEETSADKPDISEGSNKITEESDEESKLKFVSGEETTEKSNTTIKLKLGESVDNSDQTVDFEMSEASRDCTKKEMSKLTIDHIEILNDPKIIKSISDDQKNNEVNFIRLVDIDEKLTVKENFKVDNDKFVDHVNHNDSVVKDGINKVIEDDLNAEDEVETTIITKDLENPSSSCESAPNKDSFSDLQNSELADSDSDNQTVASVDKNISHSANSNTNTFSSTNLNLVKNSNMSIVKEILIESDSDKKDVLNESVCSTYDPFNPTSPNVESVGTDIEMESNKKVGVTHKTTVNPTVEHSSKIEIETDSDQKAGKSHNWTSKLTVEDLSKTEIKTDSNLTVDKLKKMTAKAIEDHSFKSEIQPKGEKNEASVKFKILKKK